jgi:hypothetical protein
MTAFATRVVDCILGTKPEAPSIAGTNAVVTAIARQAAARFGRGNVPIQFEAFTTEEAFAKERTEVASLCLPD